MLSLVSLPKKTSANATIRGSIAINLLSELSFRETFYAALSSVCHFNLIDISADSSALTLSIREDNQSA